jgi:regulator of sigma E protease
MSGLPTSVESAPVGTVLTDQALTITSVLPKSPAEIAGLKTGDKISLLTSGSDFTQTPSTQSVQYFVRRHATDPITVSYARGSVTKQITLTPAAGLVDNGPGIGISMDIIGKLHLSVWAAIGSGLKLSWNLVAETATGFYTLVHDAVLGHGNLSELTGPVGIVGVVGDAAQFGFIYLLSFTALISINLAVINLIPFPALDGGRLLFVIIEKIKGSRINPKISNTVNNVGFVLLMILMVVITYHDIAKLL